MGIDAHGLSFLRYASRFGEFKRSITIGRQGVHLSEAFIRSRLPADTNYVHHEHCEPLLMGYFGASSVDSIDNSNYESASIVHDMNLPLPSGLANSYDTVFDGGCLEHIYNVSQALRNCSNLCKPGGQVLHVLPANNFCGHGFWQFSPELFFSLYSDNNGYRNTEVFLADLANTEKWFKVRCPDHGRRVNVISASELYVLVRTVVKNNSKVSHENVQQSDYAYTWSQDRPTQPAKELLTVESTALRRFKNVVKEIPYVYPLIANIYQTGRQFLTRDKTSYTLHLDEHNPGLTPVRISQLLPEL